MYKLFLNKYLKVCLEIVYFDEIENFLLKVFRKKVKSQLLEQRDSL